MFLADVVGTDEDFQLAKALQEQEQEEAARQIQKQINSPKRDKSQKIKYAFLVL